MTWNRKWTKVGVSLLSVGVLSAGLFGGYKMIIEPNQQVEAQRVAGEKEKQVEAKSKQITSGIVISDVTSKIETFLKDGSKLSEEEITPSQRPKNLNARYHSPMAGRYHLPTLLPVTPTLG